MSLFSQEILSLEQIISSLQPQNGNTHVLIMDHFTSYIWQKYPERVPDSSINKAINEVLDAMQNNGYEIVDVKLARTSEVKKLADWRTMNTMIIYK